jgi:hypothetical protein
MEEMTLNSRVGFHQSVKVFSSEKIAEIFFSK